MATTIEHHLLPRKSLIRLRTGPAHFSLVKDADYEIRERWHGGEDLSSATITWMIAAESVDVSADMDAINTELSIGTAGGQVSVEDGLYGLFYCTVNDTDTEGIEPGRYIVVPRITLSGGDILPASAYPIDITV